MQGRGTRSSILFAEGSFEFYGKFSVKLDTYCLKFVFRFTGIKRVCDYPSMATSGKKRVDIRN